MNTQLQKLGLIDKKAIDARKVSLDEHGKLNYPLNPLVCKPSKDYNILFLFVDTLRYDMLTEEVMPNTWKFALKIQGLITTIRTGIIQGTVFFIVYRAPRKLLDRLPVKRNSRDFANSAPEERL